MTLIVFISGQFTPNYFSFLKLKPAELILIHTLDTAEMAIYYKSWLLSEKNDMTVKLVEVPPFHPSQIFEKATELKDGLGENPVILNYTAGTKPMAIQFISAFDGFPIRLMYIDTQEELIWWTDEKGTYSENLVVDMDVSTMFRIKNARILSQTDNSYIADISALTRYVYDVKRGVVDDSALMNFIKMSVIFRQTNNKKRTPYSKWNFNVTTSRCTFSSKIDQKQRCDITFDGKTFVAKEKKFWLEYFTGGWFDFLISNLLNSQAVYDDIRCNVKVKSELSNMRDQPKNEIDVLALSNGIPMFIECKTGIVDQKSITNLYASCQSYGSKYSLAVLISLFRVKDKVLREKMEQYDIFLIDEATDLEDVVKRLHQKMIIRT